MSGRSCDGWKRAAADYSPHHNPFQYYASTANPDHLAPSSLSEIGKTDQANHQYDLSYFADALNGTGGAAICTSKAITVGTTTDRCGYSQRLPLVVISPWTRQNYVSGNNTNTASVVKFIEDNWLSGERIANSFDAVSGSLDAPGGVLDFHTLPHLTPLILNPASGAVVSGGRGGNK